MLTQFWINLTQNWVEYSNSPAGLNRTNPFFWVKLTQDWYVQEQPREWVKNNPDWVAFNPGVFSVYSYRFYPNITQTDK